MERPDMVYSNIINTQLLQRKYINSRKKIILYDNKEFDV